MAYEVFEIERDTHVATVWLANPAKRNAMGPAFWEELPRVMTELVDDESVRAIVIAARGAHFTVGLDLKAIPVAHDVTAEEYGGDTRQQHRGREPSPPDKSAL